MTRHLSTRGYRTAAQLLLEHLAAAVDTIGALGCALIFTVHFLPWSLSTAPDLRQLTFEATAVLAMATLGAGFALRTFLWALADLADPDPVTQDFAEIPEADLGVYEDQDDDFDTDLDDIDWAIEAAVAIGQLRVDLKQPDADLDQLLAGIRGGHLVRQIHDAIALAADRYAERDGDQYDVDQAAELRETACYLDMASMAVGDKATFEASPLVPVLAGTAHRGGDDELTF
ncbi:hypothetical protein ACI1MP_38110 (plasmid) [Kitasatospora griseola]|uniref:hypothetical protein n=1 Tax=Kitasatospora griseola TaxID=2064 RepID=UPI003855A350